MFNSLGLPPLCLWICSMSGSKLPKIVDKSQADIEAAIAAIRSSDCRMPPKILLSPASALQFGYLKRCLNTRSNCLTWANSFLDWANEIRKPKLYLEKQLFLCFLKKIAAATQIF